MNWWCIPFIVRPDGRHVTVAIQYLRCLRKRCVKSGLSLSVIYILITNLTHQLLFIRKTFMSLYMFRDLNAHLQDDTLYTICCMHTVCPTEDENLRLETCRGT